MSKITQSSGKSVEVKDNSLYLCELVHKVESTSASFDWRGPKMTKAEWDKILSFFLWTQKEYKSESQVRLFVHPKLGWKAWAFPQQGNTGMTSKEIETEDTKKQRQEHIPEGYIAFGTVHHHCSSSAFQSGTDEADEKNQSGLHITVGKLEDKKLDIHTRMYISGHKFEPDMSEFWQLDESVIAESKQVSSKWGIEIDLDRVARTQMSEKPESEWFPHEWSGNYIVTKTRDTTSIQSVGTWTGYDSDFQYGSTPWSRNDKYLVSELIKMGHDIAEVETLVSWMEQSSEPVAELCADMVEISSKCSGITIGGIVMAMTEIQMEEELEKEVKENPEFKNQKYWKGK